MPPAPNSEIMLASGGSSPSREVREILALKESDIIEYFTENSILDEADGIATNEDDDMEMKANINNKETFNFENTNTLGNDGNEIDDDEDEEDDDDADDDDDNENGSYYYSLILNKVKYFS